MKEPNIILKDAIIRTGELIIYCFMDKEDAYISAKIIPLHNRVFTLRGEQLMAKSGEFHRHFEADVNEMRKASLFKFVVGYTKDKN